MNDEHTLSNWSTYCHHLFMCGKQDNDPIIQLQEPSTLSLCFLIEQLRSHFILPQSHIKSLEFIVHYRVEKGVLPYDESLSVIFIEPQ